MTNERTASLLAILDDDIPFQTGLQDMFEAYGMSALGFNSAEQFLQSEALHTAGCLIADLWMPDMSGLELQLRLNAQRCAIPVIFLSGRGDIPATVRAMKEGTIDFLTKPVQKTRLFAAVNDALQKYGIAKRRARENAELMVRFRSLTRREKELLPLLARGLLNKQAAAELGITECTVQIHRGNIMRKMKADSFAGLVRMAGKLSPDESVHGSIAFDG
jgi:FixJ family two-component response regulator